MITASLRRSAPALLAIVLAASLLIADVDPRLPDFGRDTVLVWAIQNREFSSQFVVRIASFLPDRFFEWEDSVGQGTVLIRAVDLANATGFGDSSLFQAGVEGKANGATALWLSQRIYRDLKIKRKSKCTLDGVSGVLTHIGNGDITIEVNRSETTVPVIKTLDNRGSERWFLDDEKNPLMVKYAIRQYSKTIASVTTNRSGTLRWIKGKRLIN